MPAMPTQPTLPFAEPPAAPPPHAVPPMPRRAGASSARAGRGRIRRRRASRSAMPRRIKPRGAGRARAGSARACTGAADLLMAARRDAVAARRPWWARLLGKLLEPWIELKIEPPTPAAAASTARPVCYVLEDYGLSNALMLDRACREAGLPSPLQPLPGDPLGRKRAYVALSRRNAGSALNRAAQLATNKPPPPAKTPFRTRWRACSRRIAPIRRSTCSWCRCRSSSAARRTSTAAGSRCCSRKTGRWSAASAACWRSCSTAATRWCSFAAPVAPARDRSTRACRPNAPCASSSRVLRTHFHRIREAVDRPGPVDAAPAGRQGAGCRTGQGSDRRPGAPRRSSSSTAGGVEEGARASPTRSPPTIRTRWCARRRSC